MLCQHAVPYFPITLHVHTSLFVTGLSTNDTKVNFLNPLSTSKSASSATLFWVKTRVLSAGTLLTTFASMRWILFLAHSSVWSLGLWGKFVRTEMSLSVKSMHSWSRAAPRFSMAGILWPVGIARGYVSTGSSFRCKCSDSVPFRKSSGCRAYLVDQVRAL